jgi:hypothetical protein
LINLRGRFDGAHRSIGEIGQHHPHRDPDAFRRPVRYPERPMAIAPVVYAVADPRLIPMIRLAEPRPVRAVHQPCLDPLIRCCT